MKIEKYYLTKHEVNPLAEVFLLLTAVIYTLGTTYISVKLDRHTSENSLVEITQASFVLLSCLLCLYKANSGHESKKLLTLFSAFFMVIFIREMDQHIELIFSHGAWKYPAWLVILSSLYYLYRNSRDVYSQAINFCQGHSFSILVIGFFMVFVFSRLAGFKDFWLTLMNDSYNRDIKNLVEEGLELLGYSFMLIGVAMINKD